ncbi:hypothetical protein [Streptomyces sp. NPDC102283]|uniref:hypothetical protein n=1 Tax=Streptomyces sp. NPDC102283 TaxID=3366155 RepID=UPI003808DEB0
MKTAADGGPHAHPDTPWANGSDTWNGFLERAGRNLSQLSQLSEENHGKRPPQAARRKFGGSG